MPISISQPHPVAWTNPTTMRAAAVLPAAGAWDTDPIEISCAGAWWARFYFTYTRDGDSGSMDYRYEISPYSVDQAGVEDWYQGMLYTAGTLTPCSDVHSNAQREYITYCSTAAGAETWIGPPVRLAGCIERIRIFCRETPGGDVGTPGDCHVVVLFYTEG